MQAIEIKSVEYEHPQDGASCVAHAWARTPATPSAEERVALKERIKRLSNKWMARVAFTYADWTQNVDLKVGTNGNPTPRSGTWKRARPAWHSLGPSTDTARMRSVSSAGAR